jgi:hypothetical protein
MREAAHARIIIHRCGATDASIRVHKVVKYDAEPCAPCQAAWQRQRVSALVSDSDC